MQNPPQRIYKFFRGAFKRGGLPTLEAPSADDAPHVRSQIDLDAAISSLAARLSAVSHGDLDSRLIAGLKRIGEALQVELIVLAQFSLDGSGHVTHSWAVPGYNLSTELFTNITHKDYPWLAGRLLEGKTVVINSLDDFPSAAAIDRETCKRRNEKSGVLVPLRVGNELRGCLALATLTHERTWPRTTVSRLRLVANLLGGALARTQTEDRLEAIERDTMILRNTLAHSQRVKAMGEMTAAFAHEINQPLTAILSNAQAAQRFLASDHPTPEQLNEFKEITRDVIADVHRAKDVMSRLRFLFRRSDTERVRLDLNQILLEVLALVRSDLVIRKINVRTSLNNEPVDILGDKIQLQQVFLNLILNSFDALQNAARRNLDILSELTGNGKVMIRITDSGSGIPKNQLETIFEPFFTTKDGGMGIGLTVNRTIIEAHYGSIWAENGVGEGATFCVVLPAAGDGR